MSEYDSGKRKLLYELLNALVFSTTVEDDTECEDVSSFIWPEDSDERVIIPFFLSLNEYNVLASAIDVGSDIAYGADAQRVISLWLRNMRCDVSICNAIRECIEQSDIVREAIIDLIVGSNEVSGDLEYDLLHSPTFLAAIAEFLAGNTAFMADVAALVPPSAATGNIYPPVPIVGPTLCGAATYIVQQVRDLIVEVYVQLSTLEPVEVWQALLNQNGWNAIELFNLITEQQASIANESLMLAAFDADSDDMICELQTHALSQDYILTWVETHFGTYTAVRPLVKNAINAAATDGRWALWATIGQTLDVSCPEDCDTPVLELVVQSGYSPTNLDFIETNGTGDVYEGTIANTGNYGVLGLRSVGSVPFFIRTVEGVGDATFNNVLQMGSPPGTYNETNLPCWVPTVTFGVYLNPAEVSGFEYGDKIRITIHEEPCPIWAIDFGYGTIVSQTPTRIELAAVSIPADGGAYNIYSHIAVNAKFHVTSAVYSPLPNGASWFAVPSGNPGGYIPDNTDVLGVVARHTDPFTIVLNGYIVS